MPHPNQLSFYSIFSAKGAELDAIYDRLGNLGRTSRSPEMLGPMLDTIQLLTKPPVRLAPEEKAEAMRIAMHALETKRSQQQLLESMSLSPRLQNFATAAYAGLLAAVMRDENRTAMELLRTAAEIPDHTDDQKVMADLPAILERFSTHIGMPPIGPEKRAAISSVFAVSDMSVEDDQNAAESADPVYAALQDLASEPVLREFVAHAYAGFFARLTQIRMEPQRPGFMARFIPSFLRGGDASQPEEEDNYLDRAWGPGFVAAAAESESGVVGLLERVNAALAQDQDDGEGGAGGEDDDGGFDDGDDGLLAPPAARPPGHDAPRG